MGCLKKAHRLGVAFISKYTAGDLLGEFFRGYLYEEVLLFSFIYIYI